MHTLAGRALLLDSRAWARLETKGTGVPIFAARLTMLPGNS